MSEILFVTDVENVLINAEETSDDPPVQNVESGTETADLDPVFDIRYFLNDVEFNNVTIENKILLEVNYTNSKRNLLTTTKKANSSDALSIPQGPTKAKLFRDGKAIDIQGGIDF